MKFSHKIIFTIVITMLLASCKKNDTSNPDGKATVTLKVTQVVPDSASVLKSFTIFANDSTHFFPVADAVSGSNINIWPTLLKYYLSNFRLQDHEGNRTTVGSEDILLVWDNTAATLRFSLGQVNPAHYHYLLFDFGVDSASNHADPTLQPSTSPLSSSYPGAGDMQWSWSIGYKFLAFEGRADTTGGHTHWVQNIHYTLTGDDMRQTISIPLDLEAQPGSNDTIAVYVNPTKLFTGMNVRTDNYSEAGSNPTTAQKIKVNIPTMFSAGF